MKKFPSMNKLEFMMAVAQLGGWKGVEIRLVDGISQRMIARRFGNEYDYEQFLYWRNWEQSGIESVEPRTQRVPKKRHRAVTDARAGRW